MNEPPSNTFDPVVPPTDEHDVTPTDKPALPQVPRVETFISQFCLSNADLRELTRVMLAVVRRMGCPEHVSPREVVHDAFVTALCKPLSDWQACTTKKQFFSRMCKIAEFAALTNRHSKHRRLLGEGHTRAEIEKLLATVGHANAVHARDALDKGLGKLDATDRALIVAHLFEGKTITEIAREQNIPCSTANSRYQGAMERLRAAMRWLVATILLLFTKNARAEHARLTWRASRWYMHASQAACTVTLTVACGVLVPASSNARVVRQDVANAVPATPSNPSLTAATASERLPTNIEVAPEKPTVVDMPTTQCSASTMTTTKLTSYLQGAVLPFALIVSPALAQVACAGAERQTDVPQAPNEDEEEDHFGQPMYEALCDNMHRRGKDCPPPEELFQAYGLCPDGTTKCHKK